MPSTPSPFAGHKTNASLEDAFWKALKQIAGKRAMSLAGLVTASILSGRELNCHPPSPFVLEFYRDQLSVERKVIMCLLLQETGGEADGGHWSWPVDVAQLLVDTTAQLVGPRPRRPGLSNRLGLWRPLHVTARKSSGCMGPMRYT